MLTQWSNAVITTPLFLYWYNFIDHKVTWELTGIATFDYAPTALNAYKISE